MAPSLVALGRDVRDPPGSATSFMPDIARSSLTSAATPHFTSLSYFPPPYKLTGRVAALITKPLIGRHFAECTPRFRTTFTSMRHIYHQLTNHVDKTLSVEIWLIFNWENKLNWIFDSVSIHSYKPYIKYTMKIVYYLIYDTNLWHCILTLNHRYCFIILIDI